MAEEVKDVKVDEEESIIDETNPTDESKQTEDEKEGNVGKRIPYDRFKEKVDEANALKKKLAEIEETQAEEERKQLEEQNDYKTLYEQALQEAEQAKQESLATKKGALLAGAGYGDEQAKKLLKIVEGETEEEIAESIKQLQATFPPQVYYGDPSAFNGAKAKPEAVDGEEVGRNAVSRVLHKIRL